METKRVEGVIVRFTGAEVWVEVNGRMLPCVLRGRFRQKSESIQVVAGDRVEVELPAAEGAPGTIEALLPRRSWLSRYGGGRDSSEKVIVANIDRLFLVVAVKSPNLIHAFIDRVLVAAEQGQNNTMICLNKVDLETGDEDGAAAFVDLYAGIGYPVLRVSAQTGDGVDALNALLTGGVYAFVGQSGVGKTSLLNRIDPSLNLKVRDVARKTGRGRHTTTTSQLYPMRGGYVADTPGMQTFGYPLATTEDLPSCFPEFRPYIGDCRFQPCTHSHEPGCAVKAAHDEGQIATTRYKSYLELRLEVEGRERY
jgi:ribosome biogenesis GTPase / thiamine phosphate phosphatase